MMATALSATRASAIAPRSLTPAASALQAGGKRRGAQSLARGPSPRAAFSGRTPATGAGHRQRALRLRVRASTSPAPEDTELVLKPQESTDLVESDLIANLIAFLKEDLLHLFDEKGIDASMYNEDVTFQDPITNYNGIDGYLFNIQFLRFAFEPTFDLHSVKQTGPYEITTRWTMEMKLGWFPLRAFWLPQFTFTGTSIMGVDPKTGKFNSHVDTWDSIKDQEFLSPEAVADLVSQFFQFYRTPDLEQPKFTILKRKANYEVRDYEPFMVAETRTNIAPPTEQAKKDSTKEDAPLQQSSASPQQAFNDLAGYIFGKNSTKTKMSMTTPVFTTEDNLSRCMQFVVPPSMVKDNVPLPEPTQKTVMLKKEEGRCFAVRKFNGISNSQTEKEVADALRRDLIEDGLKAKSGYILARYNDPSTPAFFRRNEVLIELDGFRLEDELPCA